MTSPQTLLSVVGVGWSGVSTRLRAAAEEHGPSESMIGRPLESTEAFGAVQQLVDLPADPTHRTVAAALADLLGDALLVVDDAHHLDTDTVRALATLADRGTSLAVGHRPTDREDLAQLGEILSANGAVVSCGPLDDDDLAAVIAGHLERAAPTSLVEAALAASGGLVGIALALLDGTELLDDPEAVRSRVDQQLRLSGTDATGVARILAMGEDLPDDVLATAAGIDPSDLTTALRALRDAGLTSGSGRLHPAIRTALRSGMAAAERRERHERIADALLARGGEAITAAEHLQAAGAHGASAAEVFLRAGNDSRFRSPEEALEWLELALLAGADPSDVAATRAEATVFAGGIDQSTHTPRQPADRARMLAVRAAQAARDSRAERAVELFDQATGHPTLTDEALAGLTAPSLVALGRTDAAGERTHRPSDALDSRADAAFCIASACVRHSTDPAATAPLFVEAAEALERLDLDIVLPDSAHAVGALCLSLAGDLPAAEALLERASQHTAGGPGLAVRHQLLLAWLHLRTARYELPTSSLESLGEIDLAERDQLLRASLQAGLARRSGDLPRLREAWASVDSVLLRGVTDLFHLEPLAELILAGARLGHVDRITPTLEGVRNAVAGTDHALAWAVPAAWLELHVAVELEDRAAAVDAATRLGSMPSATAGHEALRAAAAAWALVIDEQVDETVINDAAAGLATNHLPWEASRLCGQAALRVGDAAITRRLLEKARSYHHVPDAPVSELETGVVLTPREVEVSRFVLDGLTHREIGEQLFISAKTVEHHVARIRRKVGAATRAEMLAALREALPADLETHQSN